MELSLEKKYSVGESSRAGIGHVPLRNLVEIDRDVAHFYIESSSKNFVSKIKLHKADKVFNSLNEHPSCAVLVPLRDSHGCEQG